MNNQSLGPQSRVIHAARGLNRTNAISPPIWQSISFEAESPAAFARAAQSIQPAEYYLRYGNPTHEQVQAIMAELEGGEAALLTASGMGAIFLAVASSLCAGDHVVAQRNLYASASTMFAEVLPRWGIECTFADQSKPDEFAAAIRSTTKLIYVETPANPLMGITDLRAIAALGKERGITTIVDNTFATPINQQPLRLGIDVVVHSATKYLSGHHDVMAGVIVGSKEFIERAWKFSIVAGPGPRSLRQLAAVARPANVAAPRRATQRKRSRSGAVSRGATANRAGQLPWARIAPATRARARTDERFQRHVERGAARLLRGCRALSRSSFVGKLCREPGRLRNPRCPSGRDVGGDFAPANNAPPWA